MQIAIYSPQGGSGKTTIAKTLAQVGFNYVSIDPLDDASSLSVAGDDKVIDSPPHWTLDVQRVIENSQLVIVPVSASGLRYTAPAVAEALLQVKNQAKGVVIFVTTAMDKAGQANINSLFQSCPELLHGASRWTKAIDVRSGTASIEDVRQLLAAT